MCLSSLTTENFPVKKFEEIFEFLSTDVFQITSDQYLLQISKTRFLV